MIKIICIGKIKESFYAEAIAEYKKRLSKYTKLEIIELPDYGLNNPLVNMKHEKELILKNIKPKDYVITLEIDGKMCTSSELAHKIDKIFTTNSNIAFIIGGSDGLDKDVKNISMESLSFSKLTFPHQLFRIFLLEQIYRSYKINNNETYHK